MELPVHAKQGVISVVEWAERFISTPSVSRDGNRAMAELACELLGSAGITARLEPSAEHGPDQLNLIADVGPVRAGDTPDGLLMLTHLDTVPPGDTTHWTETAGDPFAPTRVGDRLYGLGSADAKVDLVCKIAGLAGLDHSRLVRPLRVVGTFCEEVGLLGARELVASGAVAGFGAALVGEPSELVAMRAHKGYVVYEARIPLEPVPDKTGTRLLETPVCGRSAHSSTPALGVNAIDAALVQLAASNVLGFADLRGGGAVNKVPDRCSISLLSRASGGGERGRVFQKESVLAFHAAWRALLARLAELKDRDFDPDHPVGNLGSVEIAEQELVLRFDIRPIPGVDPDEAVAALDDTASIECVRANPALATSVDSALVRAVTAAQTAAGLSPAVATKATCTEAGLLSAAGLDAVVLGPGISVGNVHRPNEYTLISQLECARDIYRNAVWALCGPPAPRGPGKRGAPCTS